MNFYTPNEIDFSNFVTNPDQWMHIIESIVAEFEYQQRNASYIQINGSPLLDSWEFDSQTSIFTSTLTEGVFDRTFFITVRDCQKFEILGPGQWRLTDIRGNEVSVIFLVTSHVVPKSLPEGFKEYFEGWEIPEEIGLVDVIYNNGSMDTCMRVVEITWTSFSVKGWKPSSEEDCCDALVGNGQLSDLIPDVSKLRQQESFMIVEAKAMITGKEQDIILAIGDFNAQAWEEAELSDSLIYFWMDEQQFDWIQVCGLTENNRHLDDSNYLVNVSFDTLTKFA